MFVNENDAAQAYNQKAIELFGEYVWLNTIVDPSIKLDDIAHLNQTGDDDGENNQTSSR